MIGIHDLIHLVIGESDAPLDKRFLHILLHMLVDQSNVGASQIFILNKDVESEAEEKLKHYQECNLHFKYTPKVSEKDRMDNAAKSIELSESRTSEAGRSRGSNNLDDFDEIVDCCSVAVSYDECPSPRMDNRPGSSNSKSCNFEKQITDLHKTILDALPTSEELMESCQDESNNNNATVKDMFSTLNISKRVDAIELGLVKLSNLIKNFNCVLDNYEKKLKKVDMQMETIRLMALEDVARIAKLEAEHSKKEASSKTSMEPVEEDRASIATQTLEEKIEEKTEEAEEPAPEVKEEVTEETVKERAESNVENILDAAAALSVSLNEPPVDATLSIEKAHENHQLLEQEIHAMKDEIFEKLQELENSCLVQNDKFANGFQEIRENLENIKRELLKNIEELQKQLNLKSDKTCLDELKKFVEDEVDKLEIKISDLDLSKPVAALSCRAIKDVQCLSCSNKAIQLDCVAGSRIPRPSPSTTLKIEKPLNKIHYNNPPIRLCGGIHTITGPKRNPCQ